MAATTSSSTIAHRSEAELPHFDRAPDRDRPYDASARFSNRIYWALAALGIALRLVLAFVSRGTQDTTAWAHFGSLVDRWGVLTVYEKDPLFNHPPLMGLYAAAVLRLQGPLGLPFPFLFKLGPVVADALTMVLVAKVGARRAGGAAAGRMAALYAWALVPVLVSAYHGNTDALCAFLAFLAAYLLEEHDMPFGSGLALAAAINVKLIPLLLLPAFVVSRWRARPLVRFGAGFGVGLIPFAPVFLHHAESFYRHAMAYKSNPDRWGLRYLLKYAADNERLRDLAHLLERKFAREARLAIVLLVVVFCAVELVRKRLNLYELCAAALSIFLVLTPGFGVQYLVYPCAFLFATRLTWGVWYSIWGGLFLASVYLAFFSWRAPWSSFVCTEFPPPTPLLGFLAWAVLVRAIVGSWRSAPRASMAVV